MSAYSTVLERALLPFYYGLRRRKWSQYRRLLEQSQWWSRERLLEFQWIELKRLLDHAWRTSPHYQRVWKAAGVQPGDIREMADFRKLPTLSREDLAAHRDNLLSREWTGRVYQHATGGSSGVPARFYVTTDSYDWRSAASQRAYSWSGLRLGEPCLYLWGAPVGRLTPWKNWKLNTYRRLRGELIFSTFSQSPELWEQILRAANRFEPRYLVAYVSSLEEFARFLLARQRRVASLRAAIAAAEPVFPPTRDLVREALGVELFNTYGSREFMSIGAECDRHDGLHIHAENLLVETEHPSEETASEILITDLHNYGFPFIRYRIGDAGRLDNAPCPCGRCLPRIRAVEGRMLDVLRLANGRIVPGEFFPHVLKDIPEIREFQVKQQSLSEIVVFAVLNSALSDRSRTLLQSEVAKVFGAAMRVDIEPVDSIPRRSSGKRQVTVGLGG